MIKKTYQRLLFFYRLDKKCIRAAKVYGALRPRNKISSSLCYMLRQQKFDFAFGTSFVTPFATSFATFFNQINFAFLSDTKKRRCFVAAAVVASSSIVSTDFWPSIRATSAGGSSATGSDFRPIASVSH